MRTLKLFLALLLTASLLVGCAGADAYIKDTYPLVDVKGSGKETAKVYAVAGKDVRATAAELTAKEKPDEISKADSERMFLVYANKLIQVSRDPENPESSLVSVETISYAKQHYDSSFLQGYIAATLLQTVLGDSGGRRTSGGSYSDTSKPKQQEPPAAPKPHAAPASGTAKPATSDRSGSFSTSSGTSAKPAPSVSARKNDGSAPSTKSSSKPTTTSRSGSFSTKKR